VAVSIPTASVAAGQQCAKIQDSTILDSAGNPLTVGYKYQAHQVIQNKTLWKSFQQLTAFHYKKHCYQIEEVG